MAVNHPYSILNRNCANMQAPRLPLFKNSQNNEYKNKQHRYSTAIIGIRWKQTKKCVHLFKKND